MQEIVHPKGKIYYSMGEVSEMFDVKPSLLRYWEQEFDIIKPHRNKKGNRLYTPQDVDNIKIVYHLLKERKMKIEVARKYMKDKLSDADRDAQIMERLLAVRALLAEIKDEITCGGATENEEDVIIVRETPVKRKKAGIARGESDAVAEKNEVTAEEIRPPFEEQPLFEIVPKEEFVSLDDAMDAFISKHYDPEGDEDKPEIDPFEAFDNTENVQPVEKEEPRRPVIIEQTLF